MNPIDALNLLGSNRVIWIDDRFSEASLAKLVAILVENAEGAVELCPESVRAPLLKIINGDDTGYHELEQAVTTLSEKTRIGLMRKVQLKIERNGLPDLSDEQIKSVCTHLSIADDDRWSFDRAEALMVELANKGLDGEISYMIDLNDAQGATDNARGLDLLKALHHAGSKATALLLTHYATKDDEAQKEHELRLRLSPDGRLDVAPVCVIAKERLNFVGTGPGSSTERDGAVAQALRIALKRAGLRRNVHEVLMRVQKNVQTAFLDASNAILEVPPEQLDEYVIDRAYAEGVSELHVVERALSASMSESFRQLFSVDGETRENERRLRALRGVTLDMPVTTHHPKLEVFRRQEVWESEDLVNKGCTPLACGDVFEMDPQKDVPEGHRFILLAQPCDVTLRPNGDRDGDTGFLVMLKKLNTIDDVPNQKQIRLPFLLEGKQWVCELRKASAVRLDLLDLVSYQTDGRLQYNENLELPQWLLPGQQVSGKSLFASLKKALKVRMDSKTEPPNEIKDSRCQLTLASASAFRYIAHGKLVEAKEANGSEGAVAAGFTWHLRRIGRVRMPYASALLGSYLSVLDRDAFDLDYLKPRAPVGATALCSGQAVQLG